MRAEIRELKRQERYNKEMEKLLNLKELGAHLTEDGEKELQEWLDGDIR